jgi:hypothetical protein
MDAGRDDESARAQREQGHAWQTSLEAAVNGERALREDADHATLPQNAKRATQRTDVCPPEAEGNGADAVVEERMHGSGAVHARHHHERDRLGNGEGKHHAVQVVVMVRGNDVGRVSGKVLEALHGQAEQPRDGSPEPGAQRPVEGGWRRGRGTKVGARGNHPRA